MLSFSRQEKAVVFSFVGVLLAGSAVLLVKRANPNLAKDLRVFREASGAISAEKPVGSEVGEGSAQGAAALESHIRDVEAKLADKSGSFQGDLPAPGQRIDLNTAAEMDLMLLPGIGPVRARAIVRYRKERGAFKNLKDVQKVEGIGPGVAARIEPWVCFE